jgi:hypothetical protein
VDSVEDYDRQWAKREKESFSEWVADRIIITKIVLSESMSTRATSIFKDPNVAKHLSHLYDKYVVVPAEKGPNNILFVCKLYYIDCLIKELSIDNHLATLHIPRRHIRKRKSWTIVGLFCVPLEFQLKLKN